MEKCGTFNYGTRHRIIWSELFACCLVKAGDPYAEYVQLIVFPRRQLLHNRMKLLILRTFSG